MSDTPRTDKETYLDGTDTALIGVPVVPASFAQQLERDLCAALAEKHHWRDEARKAQRGDVGERDRREAALWRGLPLLDQMDLVVIFGGAQSDGVLLAKLEEWINRKRGNSAREDKP